MDRLNTLLPLCLIAAATAMAWRERVLRQRAVRGTRGDREGRAAATRMLRLVAGDMRGVALSLLGHADTVGAADAALSGTARRLLNLSENVLNQTETPDAPRRLDETRFALLPVVEFAVAQVASQLGPNGRAWRIGPELAEVALHADQRALNQILVLVLSNAAVSTRGGDWIEISGLAEAGGWVLLVQDDGVGLPVPHGVAEGHDVRGLGFGLSLAKSLMAAHGGTLKVETAPKVGTRVRLGFPATRITPASSAPS